VRLTPADKDTAPQPVDELPLAQRYELF